MVSSKLLLLSTVFSSAAYGSVLNRRQDANATDIPTNSTGNGTDTADGPTFELISDLCLTPDEWAGSNPTDYDGFYQCFERVEHENGTADIYFTGVPDSYINTTAYGPNDLCLLPQKYTLPKPVKSANNTKVPEFGAFGIALNGVKIFGAVEGTGENAVSGVGEIQVFCDGHPQPAGIYHYHHPDIACSAKKSDDLIAWAFDGFPIYGPLEGTKDEVDAILDECNGMDVPGSKYGYQYHARTRDQVDETATDNDGPDNSDNWKYFIGCYRGETYIAEEDAVDSDGICSVAA
ncbi:YHYH protein-domain-containing protein [Calycina marina]|uniref:YHYH protein-domain-containing protein n=1 Tax=Calycina marina TaxID=1763456 RepID=A0A9P8CHM4_9HELO|nr:YHYH protein-domain-containing protein [Calycina marina]